MNESQRFHAGDVVGKLALQERFCDVKAWRWRCLCECGNQVAPLEYNLRKGNSKSCGDCGKNAYHPCPDGKTVQVTSTNGFSFFIDKSDVPLVKTKKWHVAKSQMGVQSVIASDRTYLHHLLLGNHKGMEVDHIDGNRMNNSRENLRVCTHQQNQCNQPLQRNNTSGVAGVRYYSARKKFVARIKVSQLDLHLGYYPTLLEATQARNEGMRLMFGEYARQNDVPEAPEWIKALVYEKCSRFKEKAAVPFSA